MPSRRMNSQSIYDDPVGLVVLLVMVGVTALLVWGLARVCVAYRGVRGPLLFVVLGAGGLAGYGVLRLCGVLGRLLFGLPCLGQ